MLLLVTRSAFSWAGKLRRAVLMFCPSCCKPVEMTPSCSRSPTTSSWRCRSHTQSELCLASWLCMKCTESSKTRTEGTLQKVIYPPIHLLTTSLKQWGNFMPRSLIGFESNSNCAEYSLKAQENNTFICCYASFSGNHGAA